jgi:AraC-like DNA-binding protein
MTYFAASPPFINAIHLLLCRDPLSFFLLNYLNASDNDMEGPNQILPSDEFAHWKTRVEKVKEYVSENLRGDLRITTVCKEFDLNKSTLHHIFKEQQKETYREYVERMRMEKALHLLKEGKWVKEVIPEIGYRNWGTFNVAFKKKYKYAPSFFKK